MSPIFNFLILSPFKEHIRHILLLAVYLRALCSLAKVTLVIVMVIVVMASFIFSGCHNLRLGTKFNSGFGLKLSFGDVCDGEG